jgi:hypothetical protein
VGQQLPRAAVALLQASPPQPSRPAAANSFEESDEASEEGGEQQLLLEFHGDDASSSSGSYSGSQLTELEDLEEIEDLLLQELFVTTRPGLKPLGTPGRKRQPPPHHQQQQQQAFVPGGDAAAVSPVVDVDIGNALQAAAGAGSHVDVAVQIKRQQQQQAQQTPAAAAPAGPQLLVELCSIQGLTALTGTGTANCAPLTAVIKSAGHTCCRLNVSSLLLQQQQQQDASNSGCCCPCSATIIGPSCLAGHLLATDKPCLAVELWSSSNGSSSSSSVPAAAGASSCEDLVGIVRVPLQQQQQQLGEAMCSSSTSATQLEQPCFAAGTFPVYDVLQGKQTGSLELRVLLAESQPSQQQPSGDAADAAAEHAAADELAAAAAAAAADFAAVVAVRHVIEVTVHSASHLPDAEQLHAGGQLLPESRFMRYCFPGECGRHKLIRRPPNSPPL